MTSVMPATHTSSTMRPMVAVGEPSRSGALYSSQLFTAIVGAAILVTLDVAAYTYGGKPLSVTTTSASALSLVGWAVTHNRLANTRTLAFSLYIATVVALIVLYAEQWYGGFAVRLIQLFPGDYPPGVGISNHAFVAVFPLGGTALLLLGALACYHGTSLGVFAAWFTFAWGFMGSLAVYVYPIFAGSTGTLPGMITAPLPLLISLFGMRVLLRRTNQ